MIGGTVSRRSGGGWSHTISAVRRIACLLLLLAIAGRAMIAPGFMVSMNADSSSFVVSMCSGGATLSPVHIDLDAPDNDEDESEACAFAAVATTYIAEPVFELTPAPKRLGLAGAPATLEAPAGGSAWPRGAPPTGPPIAT